MAVAEAAVKRITYLHIVPMLRMRGDAPLVHRKRSCTMTSDTPTFRGKLLLKMEGQGSFATSFRFYQPTRRHIPEDGRPNLQTKLKKILHWQGKPKPRIGQHIVMTQLWCQQILSSDYTSLEG